MRAAFIFLGLVSFACCQGGAGKPDAGEDADGGQQQDFDSVDGSDSGDGEPLQGHRIVFAPGSSACSVPYTDGRTWQEEHALLGRVWFEEKTLLLPQEPGQSEASMIRRVVVGPGRVEATPQGNGLLLHTENPDVHQYVFTQAFDLAGEPCLLEMTFNLSVDRQEIRFDEDFLGGPQSPPIDHPHHDPEIHCGMGQGIVEMRGYLGSGDGLAETQFFNSCGYSTLDLYEITVEVEGGDGLVLHQRYHWSYCGSGPANLVWARVDIQGESREVGDYFSLVHRAEHHNWGEAFLVVLEPPVGDVHAVLIEELDENTPPPHMAYLDAGLGELFRRAVLVYENGPPNVDP